VAPTAQEDAHNVQTLVRSLKMQFHEGGGEARLRLDPEHLGPVTLTVKVEQGRVSAHVQTETADAGRWIESRQQELRSSLREQGLDVKDFVVSTDPDGRRERERPQETSKPRARQRQANGTTPRFEVLV
jgi:flagellar hook-length control protein FliK